MINLSFVRKKTFNMLYVIIMILVFGVIYSNYKTLAYQKEKVEYQKEFQSQQKKYQDELNNLRQEISKLKMENEKLKVQTRNKVSKNIKKNKSIHTQFSKVKTAYLTFDDGPSPNTEKILKILKQYHVNGTFFVNGKQDMKSKELYRNILKEGHTIGNHTYSHRYNIIYSSKEQFFKDFDKLQQTIHEATGIYPNIVRFPGGSQNSISLKFGGKNIMADIKLEIYKRGFEYFDWNVDSGDAEGKNVSEQRIIQSVLSQSRNKQVINILMHDASTKNTTVKALPKIIEELKKMGFTFKSLHPSDIGFHQGEKY